ncbi:MAG: acyl carrier protein [Hyphomicrobiaceae bacterium]
MTNDELRDLIKRTLFDVAPDLEGEEIMPGEPFTEQFELDSMDFLNFVIGLHKAIGIDIPEADYPQLATLTGAAVYLRGRLEK